MAELEPEALPVELGERDEELGKPVLLVAEQLGEAAGGLAGGKEGIGGGGAGMGLAAGLELLMPEPPLREQGHPGEPESRRIR